MALHNGFTPCFHLKKEEGETRTQSHTHAWRLYNQMICNFRDADKRAQEAQKLSQYDNDSLKGGHGTNAGEVPLWRQNQIQKKRVSCF